MWSPAVPRASRWTEVAAGLTIRCRQRRRLMSYRLKGERTDRIRFAGLSYEMSFSLEPADHEQFAVGVHRVNAGGNATRMLQRFEPSGRFETGALSYVNIELRDKSLCVQAFHTFPDDSAVLKIQSWYRLAVAGNAARMYAERRGDFLPHSAFSISTTRSTF